MFDAFHNRLTVTGNLMTETALRIGAGRDIDPAGTDLPGIKDALGQPFIPGSSFKGVLRSRVESYLRAVVPGKRGACNPVGRDDEHCLPTQQVRDIKNHAVNDAKLAQTLWDGTCLACRTFGAPWLASTVYVKDLQVPAGLWLGQYQVRNGVAIDRDTETASEGLLYDYEVVPAGTAFEFTLVTENARPWQLGLLLLGLAPFERGEISVGGATSRGLGLVALHDLELRYFSLDGGGNGHDQAKVEQLIGFLQHEGQGELVTRDSERHQQWIAALRAKLLELVAN